MLAFITTIRHPDNAFSFERIEALLSETLRSVCRHTDESFRVIIVANCDLTLSFTHPNTHFVTVDFPASGVGRGRHLDYAALTHDKGTKAVIGVSKASELGADHVMFIDSDDYLHRNLAEFSNSHGEHPGWFSSAGYIYTSGLRCVHPIETDFHHKNGSTSIVRTDLIGVPSHLNVRSSQTEITDAMGLSYVSAIIGQHGKWAGVLSDRGYVMESLPFPAAIWTVGTGENHTGNLVSSRVRQPINQALSDQFGLPLPSLSTTFRTSAGLMARRAQRRLVRAGRREGRRH
jgi:hypothetical protein